MLMKENLKNIAINTKDVKVVEVDLKKTNMFSIGQQYNNKVLVIHFINEIKAQNESEMNTNRTEFNKWLETVKDMLDANTAGKLSNRISNIEKMIMENHFTTILLTEDGTLADENGEAILVDWAYEVEKGEVGKDWTYKVKS